MDLTKIGRYDIKRVIGQGGMATVYLGYDPRSRREVAIKVLPPYFLRATTHRERFEREAQTIALLEHPAIVPVYDMGEDDGQPYIVMRYMSGGSLADRLIHGPIPIIEIVEMFSRLAPALDAAHAKGVIHRDVKPDNILFDQYGNVFLSDFGLARLKESLDFAKISDGSIMGTPAYMSPEQIQGKQDLDGRSDIYSLGVVLYHMLCGIVPYTGSTAASVMMMHLINPVPRVYEKNEALPTAIQVVLERAMSKNPPDRYSTAAEMSLALQDAAIGYQKGPKSQGEAAREAAAANATTLIFPTQELEAAAGPVSQPEPVPASSSAERRAIPVWGWMLGGVGLVVLFAALLFASRGSLPFSSQPTPTIQVATSSATHSPAMTSPPAASPTALPPPIVLGGADKLAFVNANDIWVSNLDGGELLQLTTDGNLKSNLQWAPNEESIIYTSAECIYSASLKTHQSQVVSCFKGISSLEEFLISPDGHRIAIGINENELYLVKYDLERLEQVSAVGDLKVLADCLAYAPYRMEDRLRSVRWSSDSQYLTLLGSTLSRGAYRDSLKVMDFGRCYNSPPIVHEVLPMYLLFTLRGYYERPEIPGFAWDGEKMFLLNGFVTNDGYGDLQLYDMAKSESQTINPVNNTCCYREAAWSPDRQFMFFVYQKTGGTGMQLYYVSLDDINAGVPLTPIPLPDDIFANSLQVLQPALRTASDSP